MRTSNKQRAIHRTWIHWSLALPALTFTAAHADTRIPLALSRAGYALRAGGTVKLELPSDSSAAVLHGQALRSHTTPDSMTSDMAHAPFVTADTQGNLVVAVPVLAL